MHIQEVTAERDAHDPARVLFQDLSETAGRAYGKLTRGEPLACQERAAVDELVSWGLVGFDPATPGEPVPLDPGEAVQRRTRTQLQHLAQQAETILRGPEITDRLSALFDRTRWQSGSGSEYLAERQEVNARIEEAFTGARVEILTAQPNGPRTQEHKNIALRRDLSALRRGVQIRTLYRDTARDDALTREWAQTMTAEGAAYRTLTGAFEKVVVVDRRVAFIRDYVGDPDASADAAWKITDRPMVAFIAQVFEETWRRAVPWFGDAVGARTTRMERAVIRESAAGIPQEVTAKRLGVSVRQVQRVLSEMRKRWGAPTVGALLYQFALSPDRLVDDSAPDDAATAGETDA